METIGLLEEADMFLDNIILMGTLEVQLTNNLLRMKEFLIDVIDCILSVAKTHWFTYHLP